MKLPLNTLISQLKYRVISRSVNIKDGIEKYNFYKDGIIVKESQLLMELGLKDEVELFFLFLFSHFL
jgi:hypothetical protein